MKEVSSLLLRLLLTAAITTTIAGVAVANDRFEIGDEVEVLFLGDWFPGTVVDMNRQGAVLAEFTFAASKKREVFAPNFVRHNCEVGAIAPVREWQDASGKFKIRAAVVRKSDETVKLRKLDLEVIDVPISALSNSDQRFLRKVPKGAAPISGNTANASPKMAGTGRRVPGMPGMRPDLPGLGGPGVDGPTSEQSEAQIAVERLSTRADFGAQVGASDDAGGRVALAPDPLPSHLVLQEGGALLPDVDQTSYVSAIIPIGGSDAWLLAAVETREGPTASPTQLVWVSLARNKIEGQQWLPPGEKVLDYHAASHRLLTRAQDSQLGMPEKSQEQRPLTVWEVLPSDDEARPVIRWTWEGAPSNTNSGGTPSAVTDRWIRLADGNTVIQPWVPYELVAWDIAAKEMRYRIARTTSWRVRPALSGTRKYLFLPEEEGVRILNSLTGQVLSVLPTDYAVNAVAVTDDGRRLATVGTGSISVWDLTDASAAPQEYQAESLGASYCSPLRWQNDERLWASNQQESTTLFSLKHRAVIWNFQFSKNLGTATGIARAIVRDHVAYSASVSAMSLGTLENRGLAIGAARLPGPKVDEADAQFDREAIIAIKPGSPIRIVVDAGENNARVRNALEQAVQKSGWVLASDSTTVLTAKMGRHEKRQVTYYDSDDKPVETVTVTPYFSAVTIEYEGKEVLTRGSRNIAPGVVFLQENETVQQKIDETEVPDVEFFERLRLPREIVHPEKRKGMGTSKLTKRGLVVVEPTRSDSPVSGQEQTGSQ